jgi:hypothetical protein
MRKFCNNLQTNGNFQVNMAETKWPADKTRVPFALASFIPITLVVAFARDEINGLPLEKILNYNEQTFSTGCTQLARMLQTKFSVHWFASLPKLELYEEDLANQRDVLVLLRCSYFININVTF